MYRFDRHDSLVTIPNCATFQPLEAHMVHKIRCFDTETSVVPQRAQILVSFLAGVHGSNIDTTRHKDDSLVADSIAVTPTLRWVMTRTLSSKHGTDSVAVVANFVMVRSKVSVKDQPFVRKGNETASI